MEPITHRLFRTKPDGFLIGRNGTTEVQAIMSFLKKTPLSSSQKYYLSRTGFFCGEEENINESIYGLCKELLLSIGACDVIVRPWYAPTLAAETEIIQRYAPPHVEQIELKELEPYYTKPSHRWTAYLHGQRVGIISPFAETAVNQIKRKRELLWLGDTETLLPDATYVPIRTYFPSEIAGQRAGWPTEITNWEDAVSYLEKQCIGRIDVAIIGCGSMGMILGSRLKLRNIRCIVMGGATQCLFGIKGRRWEKNIDISGRWNNAWVGPSEDETPDGWESIEGGCYWL